MVIKTKSSKQWLKEHFKDPYVKQAQAQGYRSRAVFKLLEIQKRHRLFKPGMRIIDLGAAPGGWSQVASQLVKPNGAVVAIDILPMTPLPGVEILQGDFGDDAIYAELMARFSNPTTEFDWVLSDMAPNLSGNATIDMPRVFYLAELALDFARSVLKPDGGFLIKLFQGSGFESFLADTKKVFRSVTLCKPSASRMRSREIYLLAKALAKTHCIQD